MPIWETEADWDNFQSQNGVHHEQPANTQWSASDKLEKGYATTLSGLVGYWPMDEDAGTTMNDVSGNGNDGTIAGATLNPTGVLGTRGIDFSDASNETASIPNNAPLEPTSAMSVVFWGKAPSQANCSIVRHDGHVTPWQINSGDMQIAIWPGGSLIIKDSKGYNLGDGNFHFYVLQYEETTGTEFYVDDMVNAFYSDGTTGALGTTAKDWWLASAEDGGEYADATIDELMIFNTFLTQTERQNLKNAAL